MTRASDAAGDEAYGGRVFLHHYGVHLAGPDLDRATAGYPGDRLAARGFNGDVGRHARSWRHRLATSDPAALGSRAARKTLFAVAGLVSVHDSTWTTDRMSARRRWQQLHPELAPGLAELSGLASGRTVADRDALARLPTRSSTRSCGSSPT